MVKQSRDEVSGVLQALADPTRRELLRRAAEGEIRVSDLAEGLAMSLPAVSKHIGVLERVRLLERRTVGREHFLRFKPEPLAKVRAEIERFEEFPTARFDPNAVMDRDGEVVDENWRDEEEAIRLL